MSRGPSKFADSKAELVRTVAACLAAAGTLYLVGTKLGFW